MTFFLGGWLTVVCQNCMAHSTEVDIVPESKINSHCNESEESKSYDSKESCEEICDCSAVISNIKNNTELEFYLPLKQQIPVFSSVIDKNLFLANQVSYKPNHSLPKCPHLSPINTYCVQIK